MKTTFDGTTGRYQVTIQETSAKRTNHTWRDIWLDDEENAHRLTPREARELARLLIQAADQIENPSNAPMLSKSNKTIIAAS